jgi:hypothetical protein
MSGAALSGCRGRKEEKAWSAALKAAMSGAQAALVIRMQVQDKSDYQKRGVEKQEFEFRPTSELGEEH